MSLTLGHACMFITFFVCGMYNRVLDETRFQSANITDIVVCIPGTRKWVMSIECAEFKSMCQFLLKHNDDLH